LSDETKLEYLSTVFDDEVFELISVYINNMRTQVKNILTRVLISNAELLREPLKNKDVIELTKGLECISTHLC
jgi:hypothetical protein